MHILSLLASTCIGMCTYYVYWLNYWHILDNKKLGYFKVLRVSINVTVVTVVRVVENYVTVVLNSKNLEAD